MADLTQHDRSPSSFLVYLALARRTLGAGRPHVTIALADIAESSGLSKRTVQAAISHLARRKLVSIKREHLTSVPTYTVHRPWRRS